MSKNQKQIYEEKKSEEQVEEKADMREFLKDMKGLHKRVNYATYEVQQQDKRLVGVNEKLDDYNKEVSQGDDLLNIVNKGVFSSFFSGIKNIFSSKKTELDDKDKEILKKAKNKETKINEDNNNLNFKEDGEWSIIKKGEDKKDKYDEDEIIDESIKEVKGMINSVKNFNKNVKESIDVVNVTNKHIDKSSKHVKKVNKKMEGH